MLGPCNAMTIQQQDLAVSRVPARAAAPVAQPHMGDFRIIHRLVRDYMSHQWAWIAFAVVCILVTAGTTGGGARLSDPTVKYIFVQRNREMLMLIPLADVGILILRALSAYGADSTINTVGERI